MKFNKSIAVTWLLCSVKGGLNRAYFSGVDTCSSLAQGFDINHNEEAKASDKDMVIAISGVTESVISVEGRPSMNECYRDPVAFMLIEGLMGTKGEQTWFFPWTMPIEIGGELKDVMIYEMPFIKFINRYETSGTGQYYDYRETAVGAHLLDTATNLPLQQSLIMHIKLLDFLNVAPTWKRVGSYIIDRNLPTNNKGVIYMPGRNLVVTDNTLTTTSILGINSPTARLEVTHITQSNSGNTMLKTDIVMNEGAVLHGFGSQVLDVIQEDGGSPFIIVGGSVSYQRADS